MDGLEGYRDGGLLLSMWLCLSLVKGVQKKSLTMLTNSEALEKVLKDHVKAFGLSPHPEVAMQDLTNTQTE